MSANRKLSIIHINTTDITGGAAKVAWSLSETQQRAGHYSKMIVSERAGTIRGSITFSPEADPSLQEFCEKEGQLYYEFQGSHKLVNEPLFQSADILHLHNLHGQYFNPFSVSSLSHLKPTIWTLHDMQSFTGHCAHSFECNKWMDSCGECPDLKVYPKIMKDSSAQLLRDKKLIYDHSYLRVVVPSQWLKGKVERSVLNGHTVELIPNGIDTDIFQPRDREEARKKFGIPSGVLAIGAVSQGGSLNNPWKGGEYTRAVLEALRQKMPECVFVNIGAGYETNDPDIINIPHILDEAQLAMAYSALDIFLYTPKADNCPLVILEAMSCGIPIATFDTGGIPELVRDGLDGCVTKFGDNHALLHSLERLANSEELRTKYSSSSRERALSEFDNHIVADRYEKLYLQSLIEDRVTSKQISLLPLNEVPDVVKGNAFFAAEKAKVESMVAILLQEGMVNEAHEIIQRAIDKCPESPALLNYMAELKFQSENREEAKLIFQDITRKWPDYATAYNNLAVISWEEGDLKTALQYFIRAIKNDPDDRNTIMNCSRLLNDLGKHGETETLCMAYLQKHPHDEEISQLMMEADRVG